MNRLDSNKYPSSWYVVAKSNEVKIGKIREITMYDKSYIIYRAKNNDILMFDKYCPHMGASLALGKIFGDCIRCPFHHWTFDQDGYCTHIPSLDKLPKRAKLNKLTCIEKYGRVFAWLGTETPLFDLPVFNAATNFKQQYIQLKFVDYTVGSMRQVLENSYDYFHFIGLHGLKPSSKLSLENLDLCRDKLNSAAPYIDEKARFGVVIDCPVLEMDFVSSLFGINGKHMTIVVDGWPSGQFVTTYLDGEELYQVMISIQLIDSNSLIQHTQIMIKKQKNIFSSIFNYIVYALQNRYAVFQDQPIYANTQSGSNGVLTAMDSGVIDFRKFYHKWINITPSGNNKISEPTKNC